MFTKDPIQLKSLFSFPDSIPTNLTHDIKSLKEEKADMLSHGFGIVLFLILGPILIYKVAQVNSHWLLAGTIIFWITLLMVYTSSTLYHSSYDLERRKKFRTLDHICIYFLIAGSYTPFIFHYFRDQTGWPILITLWSMTVIGSFFKYFYTHKFKLLSTIVYVIMGWMAVLIVEPLMAKVSPQTFTWIVIGGASYTVGVIFYLWESLYMNHLIWHLFVLGGSLSHLIAVWYCL